MSLDEIAEIVDSFKKDIVEIFEGKVIVFPIEHF